MPPLSSFENDSLWQSSGRCSHDEVNEHIGVKNQCENINNKKPRRSRKSVTFALSCRVRVLVDDNDESNVEQRWLQPQDYETIRQERLASLDRIVRGTYSNHNDCFRGLEAGAPCGAYQKRTNRNKAWNAVFLEQDFQWKSGITNPEIISMVYYSCSRACQENATLRGLQDEREVKSQCWSSSLTKTWLDQTATRHFSTAPFKRSHDSTGMEFVNT